MKHSAHQLYAKSPVPGGESLPHHTLQVVRRMMQLRDRLPALPSDLGIPHLWEILFWAAWFHDFGKAASGFQAMLAGSGPWGYRHEILSLAFLHWVFPVDTPAFAMAAAAVASHHRDFAKIEQMYIAVEHPDDSGIDVRWKTEMDAWRVAALAEWTVNEAPAVAAQLGIELHELPLLNVDVDRTHGQGPDLVRTALAAYTAYYRRQAVPKRRDRKRAQMFRREALCLRGFILQADRLASADAPALIQPEFNGIMKLLAGFDLWNHQKKAAEASGNVILAAPTGSGKTEAALLWAVRRQKEEDRRGALFYLLPYQASINAMHRRFRKRYGVAEEHVALMHSRAVQSLYRELVVHADTTVTNATRNARRSKSLARLHQQPFCVATPYQLLRAAFRLPGYEGQWVMMRGGYLVVDEVHGYEPMRLGLLLELFATLRRDWDAGIFCMTATMPGWLNRMIQDIVGIDRRIQADAELFRDFRRHQLRMVDGMLTDRATVDAIAQRVRAGESVLVVANMVDTAKEVARHLREKLGNGDEESDTVLLLHSRFNGEDRLHHEQTVMERMEQENREGFVLVATQVVEVSLDVDFDTIYTEPAPLEALLQRFGRVNRRRRYRSRPVHVMREPVSWKHPYGEEPLLRRTVALLEDLNGTEIDEAAVEKWLDQLYEPDMERLIAKVEEGRRAFQDICGPEQLIAFASDPDVSRRFDELFDGYEILPAPSYREFRERIDSGRTIEAYGLLVPVSRGTFMKLFNENRLHRLDDHFIHVADCAYDHRQGLLTDEPAPQQLNIL